MFGAVLASSLGGPKGEGLAVAEPENPEAERKRTMLLVWPNSTPYDLRFRLLGVPVQVHPGFWAIGILFGFNQADPKQTVVWIAVLFLSILWHEMGHAIAAIANGLRPKVALYWMGGLCASDRNQVPLAGNLAIILGGPGAGFVLGLLTLLVANLTLGVTPVDSLALFGLGPGDGSRAANAFDNRYVFSFFYSMIFINFAWTLVNLLPVWSLDGGQFLGEILSSRDPYRGMRQTHFVGMVTAAGVALFAASREQIFITIFFGLMAFSNYQATQAMSGGGGGRWGRGY